MSDEPTKEPEICVDTFDKEIEIKYSFKPSLYINAQALILSYDEASLLHARLGEILRRVVTPT